MTAEDRDSIKRSPLPRREGGAGTNRCTPKIHLVSTCSFTLIYCLPRDHVKDRSRSLLTRSASKRAGDRQRCPDTNPKRHRGDSRARTRRIPTRSVSEGAGDRKRRPMLPVTIRPVLHARICKKRDNRPTIFQNLYPPQTKQKSRRIDSGGSWSTKMCSADSALSGPSH